MTHKNPTIDGIKKRIAELVNDGLTDATSQELHALRKELRSVTLDANDPPAPPIPPPPPPPPPSQQKHVSDCVSVDYD